VPVLRAVMRHTLFLEGLNGHLAVWVSRSTMMAAQAPSEAGMKHCLGLAPVNSLHHLTSNCRRRASCCLRCSSNIPTAVRTCGDLLLVLTGAVTASSHSFRLSESIPHDRLGIVTKNRRPVILQDQRLRKHLTYLRGLVRRASTQPGGQLADVVRSRWLSTRSRSTWARAGGPTSVRQTSGWGQLQ
jgi:hypothetical protein